MLLPLHQLPADLFEAAPVLKKLVAARARLAELKGIASSIPHQGILINTLGAQEAKDSSEIENIITTHDELFQHGLLADDDASPASKEVARYRQALRVGFTAVKESGLLTLGHILDIQVALEQNHAGWRKLPGTTLKNTAGQTVYTPPSPEHLPALMGELERFINDADLLAVDPLIKMALIHHQFESIHPFYDGNGRTGRIINVLYLVKERLLDIPVLYLSRAIVRSKHDYYRLLQAVREHGAWQEWVLYMLDCTERTAGDAIATITAIKALLLDYKHRIRAQYRFYSQDLINNLFMHPYTKIEFIQHDLKVTRVTATKYLETLAQGGFVRKQKLGRHNFYINQPLFDILTDARRTGI